ncbi:hypothetical protein C8R48DRAFT_767214 [Suillus tomentosus]|nr:hypothetical protein C8R48DRAFT_767214 [Suillus tomentosus]
MHRWCHLPHLQLITISVVNPGQTQTYYGAGNVLKDQYGALGVPQQQQPAALHSRTRGRGGFDQEPPYHPPNMRMGQKPLHRTTVNLLTSPPDPCELVAIPTPSSMLNKSKIMLGLVITPYRTLKEGEPPVPVVTDTVIAPCRQCRAYINPHVQFIDNGNWDELNHSVIEFVVPTEYMVRPPQSAVYVILINVSHSAVQSGMVATAIPTILENLDHIPNEDERTQVAIIAYDVSLYFFSMPPMMTQSTMLVVIDDIFLPKPTDLLINLMIITLLEVLWAPHCKLALSLWWQDHGTFILFAKYWRWFREDLKSLGTSKESGLLQTASPFYKTFAIECSRAQVSVDMFLFSAAYQDLASHTSGQTYFYPAFNSGQYEDAIKFTHEFGEVLAMPIILEAVMRVHASKDKRSLSLSMLINAINVCAWLRSRGTSSSALLTFPRCPPISLTPLRSRSSILLRNHL